MNNASSRLWDPIVAARGGKASAGDKPAEAVAIETPDQIAERVRVEEAERAANIAAACALGDCPDRAAAFVADGKSLSDVLAILVRERNRPKGLASFRQRPEG